MPEIIQKTTSVSNSRTDFERNEGVATVLSQDRIQHRPEDARFEDDVTVLGAILKRTSWGALIAGTVVAISVQMILTVLGIAIGVTSSEVVAGAERVQEGITTAAGVWWLASGAISLFIGGCVVGRFAGLTRSPDVLLHGFTMWAVTALFGFLVVTTGAGALYGTAMNSAYVGTQSGRATQYKDGNSAQRVSENSNATDSVTPPQERVISAAEAQRYIRTASWWTLVALGIGIIASLAGSWATAPDRIAVRAISQRTVGHSVRT